MLTKDDHLMLDWHPSKPGGKKFQGRRHIGYWVGHHDPDLADPHDFVDMSWDQAKRAAVAERLRLGTPIEAWMGYSSCRFCNKANGTCCLTADGQWVWPEGLAHYITDHGVRLPQEFVSYLLALPDPLIAELKAIKVNLEAIQVRWEPYEDGTGCPDKGTHCEEDATHKCIKRHPSGGGIFTNPCQWASDRRREEFNAERDRHSKALESFVELGLRWKGPF